MFDRDLAHWYRDLFFTPSGLSYGPATDFADVPELQKDRTGDLRRTRWLAARRRWERTDPS